MKDDKIVVSKIMNPWVLLLKICSRDLLKRRNNRYIRVY